MRKNSTATIVVVVVLGAACAALSWSMMGNPGANWMAPMAFWAGVVATLAVVQ